MRRINIGDKVICTESNVVGTVIKFYIPTACEEQTMVETVDGRKYHAPTRTWRKYKDGLNSEVMIYDESLSLDENIERDAERITCQYRDHIIDMAIRSPFIFIEPGELRCQIEIDELVKQTEKSICSNFVVTPYKDKINNSFRGVDVDGDIPFTTTYSDAIGKFVYNYAKTHGISMEAAAGELASRAQEGKNNFILK